MVTRPFVERRNPYRVAPPLVVLASNEGRSVSGIYGITGGQMPC